MTIPEPAMDAARRLPPESRSHLTTVEVASLYPISANYLKRLRTKGGGPAFTRWGPKKIVYDVRDIERFMDERKHRSTSEYAAVAA